ncbi:MAG: GNAT family N-acetyltransferase [Terrimicrobiaceae bacterium]|nr:GNAT family N-acetyltransferase [Terrimicrobiaceae bacterium]
MDTEVRHNPDARRFEIPTGRSLAVCDYIEAGGELVLTHTFVPPEARGGGLAGRLVDAAVAYADERKLRIVPVCSYVAAHLRRRERRNAS